MVHDLRDALSIVEMASSRRTTPPRHDLLVVCQANRMEHYWEKRSLDERRALAAAVVRVGRPVVLRFKGVLEDNRILGGCGEVFLRAYDFKFHRRR